MRSYHQVSKPRTALLRREPPKFNKVMRYKPSILIRVKAYSMLLGWCAFAVFLGTMLSGMIVFMDWMHEESSYSYYAPTPDPIIDFWSVWYIATGIIVTLTILAFSDEASRQIRDYVKNDPFYAGYKDDRRSKYYTRKSSD